MNTTPMPALHPLRAFLLACCCLLATLASAQQAKYWTGGTGRWSDAANWSDATGRASVGAPRADEAAVIHSNAAIEILIDGDARCAALIIDANGGSLRLSGAGSALRTHGDVRLSGAIDWRYTGTLVLEGEGDRVFDPRGNAISGDVLVDVEGTVDMQGALMLENNTLVLKQGTLRTNDKAMVLAGLRAEGRRVKRLEAGGAIVLAGSIDAQSLAGRVDPGSSTLLVDGHPLDWNGHALDEEAFMRGITNCGTGAGQTPFQINAQLTTNYNGWGVSCTGACDGAVTVTITGGVGPNFSRQWAPGGPTTPNWGPICAGNKLVTVIDLGQGVGCFASVQVTEPPPLGVIFFGLNPPTCADACNGTAVTFPGGGTGIDYNYDWNNGTENSSNPSQLCAGINTLELSDNNGCIFDTTFTIDLQPLAATLTQVGASCFGECDGTASIAVTGGTPDYNYAWEPGTPPGDGTPNVTGLCAGNYSVLVTDDNGCDTTLLFTITQPVPIAPGVTVVPASCSNACDGSATAAPSGTAGPFSFNWEPGTPTGEGTGSVTALCPGNYTVLITDLPSGCDTLVPFVITAPPAIDVQLTTTDVTCAGVCDGTGSIIIAGGTPGYVIVWGPGVIAGQGTPAVTALCAGDYTVTVTDLVGCDTTIDFTINEPLPILPDEVVTPITCAGACDGSIVVAPGYTYDWTGTPSNGDFTNSATGLCAGTWTVLISDGVCDTLLTIELIDPLPIVIAPSQTNVTCGNLCDGTASAVVTGGNDPYTYSWAPNPGGGQGTADATAMCAGPYTLTVTDSVGCVNTQPYDILPPVPLQVSVTVQDATCPDFCNGSATATVVGGNDPYTFAWSPEPGGGQGTANATGLCAGDYDLTVTDSVGCDTTITITITSPLPIEPNTTITQPTCPGSCNGSIVLAPVGGFGTFTYTWTPAPPNGPGTNSATSLCAGTWQVVIASGICDTTLVFTIVDPPTIDAQVTTTPTDCDAGCTGTATAVATGGSGDLSYVWAPQPGGGQNTPAAFDMCAAAYTLTITDSLGCDTVLPVTITAPDPIIPQLTTIPASCGGACDGEATVSWTGGNGPVTIVWSPATTGQGTTTASDMCPGVYTVTLTDSVGCDTTVQFAIVTPSGIVAVPTATNTSCGDVCDGTIVLNITGGLPGYTVAWTPAPPAGSGTSISGLCQGTWSALITDAAQCDTVVVVQIGGPLPISPNGTFTNETCNGPCDGTATVSPTGGSSVFVYDWSPVPASGQGTATVTGLCAGDHCVTITDDTGCDTTWCFTILPQQPIDAQLTAADATCFGACNGSANVAVAGGVPDYDYLWSPNLAIGQGTDSVSALCLGQYTVTITDAAGCDTSLTFTINKPAPITTSLVFTPADCNDVCSGEAATFPSGGVGPYLFDWQPPPGSGQGGFFVDGLCAGTTYSLTITDSLGCDTTESFTVMDFTPITAQFSTTPETCAGACDGTATLAAIGGEGPYTYDWTPDPGTGDGTPVVGGMCPGTYDVLITDADGCDTTISVLITGPQPLVVFPLVTNVRCNGECNGNIVINSFGGTGPLTYVWTPAPPVGQGTANAQQLCAGTYDVLITDSVGCDTTLSFTLVDPPPFSVGVSVTQSECQACIGVIALDPDGAGPYNFNWGAPIFQSTPDSVQTDLCAGLYPVIAIDAFGCAIQLDIPVSDSNGEIVTTTDDNVTCPTDCDGTLSVVYNCSAPVCSVEWFDPTGFPLFITTDTVSGLCPGSYFVQVTNGDGCITIDTATVFAPEPMVVQFGTTPVSCAGECDGTAGFGIVGGEAPYTITWSPDPGTGQGTPNATGLCAGTYTVVIVDDNGCTITADVLILGPQPIDANATVTPVSCAGACDASIILDAQGGNGVFTYTWDPVPPNGQGGNSAIGLCAGDHTVVISDGNGCDTTIVFTIADPAPIDLVVSATPSTCAVCTGMLSAGFTGGSGNVVITWTDVNNNVIGVGGNLMSICAGLYTATAVDDNGCMAQAVAAVSDPTGEVLTITNGQTLCANDCNATVAVSFNCTAGPCEIFWYDEQAQQIAVNVFQLTDLCAGLYIVQVDNGAGCSVIDTAIVAPSQTIIPNLSSTPVTCSGLCDGTATVGPQGGIGPYIYDWSPDPVTGDGTPSVTGLCAGVYSVEIRDASGCDTTIQVLITAPEAFTMVAQVNDVECNAFCDGSIGLVITGGTGTLTYVWSPQPGTGQGTPDAGGLCAGDYTVLVADANGCDTTFTFTVAEPPPLTVTTSSTTSTCSICSGTVDAEASGGTPGYAYAWTLNNALFGTDSALVDLCAGIYILTVTDANGCQVQQATPVQDANGEVLNVSNDVVTCPGDCDGEVTVDFQCGVPTCTITWTDALGIDLGVPGNTLSALCPGTYYVEVINGDGCLTIDTATVTAPQPIVPNLSTTPTSCDGACDGTATVGPTGGVAPYTFDWEPGVIQGDSTPVAVGLCAGFYGVLITDTVGCQLFVDVLIDGPVPITATAEITPVSCNGGNDGAIVLDAQGGTGQLGFFWTPTPPVGQGTFAISQLNAGTWTVVISDVNGCDSTYSYTLDDPTLLEVDLTLQDDPCFGACIGSASMGVSGGRPPYTITWTTSGGQFIAQGPSAIFDLCAGDYVLIVTDSSLCTQVLPFNIGQPPAIDVQLDIVGETCNGPCDGTASATISGGNNAYTIQWADGLGQVFAQDTTDVSGLCSGDYSITVIDTAGCDTVITFTIAPYTTISASTVVQQVQCNGACDGSLVVTAAGGIGVLTYDWEPTPPSGDGTNSATGLCPGTYSLTITDAVLCDTTLTFDITEPPPISIVIDQVVEASCNTAFDGAIQATVAGGTPQLDITWNGPNGFFAAGEDITAIAPGDYVVTVQDDNGCMAQQNTQVGAIGTVIADAGEDQELCEGTDVTIDASNSTGAALYTWMELLGNEVGNTAIVVITSPAPGTHTYILNVTDGPCSDQDTVVVTVLASPFANAGPDQEIFLQGEALLGAQPSGPQGSTFNWAPDSLLNNGAVANPIATPGATTLFILTVTSPEGCSNSDSVIVTVIPEIIIPSGFTPTGDGANDVWQIDHIDRFPDCTVEVYNRWGELLFTSTGYTDPWDGTYNGAPVPVGTYYYAIELNDERFPDPYTGPITVIR